MNPFAEPFMQRAACAIALAAVLGASVGVWVVLRRMALIGDALAHASLPGVVLARWWGIDVYLGGLAAALIAVSGVAGLTRPGRLGEDTALGILMAGSLALGVALAQAHRHGHVVQLDFADANLRAVANQLGLRPHGPVGDGDEVVDLQFHRGAPPLHAVLQGDGEPHRGVGQRGGDAAGGGAASFVMPPSRTTSNRVIPPHTKSRWMF